MKAREERKEKNYMKARKEREERYVMKTRKEREEMQDRRRKSWKLDMKKMAILHFWKRRSTQCKYTEGRES